MYDADYDVWLMTESEKEFPRTPQTRLRGGKVPCLGRTASAAGQEGELLDRIETAPRRIMGDGAEDAFEHAMDERYDGDFHV